MPPRRAKSFTENQKRWNKSNLTQNVSRGTDDLFAQKSAKALMPEHPCWRCGAKNAPFGYGFPILAEKTEYLWLCADHRKKLMQLPESEQRDALRQLHAARIKKVVA